jgi:hypothetical protein
MIKPVILFAALELIRADLRRTGDVVKRAGLEPE